MKHKRKQKTILLGLAINTKDEHTRITKGDDFTVVGGSQEVHEEMQDKAIKFTENLNKNGKQLHELSRNEFMDLADKAGMIQK